MLGGTNLSRVGDYNRQLVLETIRLEGVSRVEIAQKTGLTSQTITNIVRKLLGEGLVVEIEGDGEDSGNGRKVGKPRVRLEINATAKYALGVQIDRDETNLALLDLGGRVIGSRRQETNLSDGPEGVVDRMVESLEDLLGDTVGDRSKVLGLGVASPGPLDPESGKILGPVGMPGWDMVPLKQMLEERTGFGTTVENDAVASAIGERWVGEARSARNFMFVYMGWGIGAGFFVSGQIYRGSSGTAGEIAHMPLDPNGQICWCGKRGCLIHLCSASAVVESALKGRDGAPSKTAVAFEEVCRIAGDGDIAARTALDNAGSTLGSALAGIVDVLDLELVVLGGRVFHQAQGFYLPTIRKSIRNTILWKDRREIRVQASGNGQIVGAVGGASVILHKYFAPQVAGLELSRLQATR